MRNEPHRLFSPFRLDPLNAQLWRGDQEISLRRKTFDVLYYLVDHPGQLVTKAALLDAVWADVTVSDSMPAVCVFELRKALGDEAGTPRFIETVHRRGYRFIAKVTTAAAPEVNLKPPLVPKHPKPIIVGREQELAQLRRWYSQILGGERLVAFVAGEAGIGKTTFVEAFLDSIAQEGAVRMGRGQCVEQYGAGEPYMPVLEALSRLGREPGGERLVEVLNRFAPTWLAQMPALLEPDELARLQGQNQGVTQQRMLREMAQALEALVAEVPLVLLLEDLHWSDFSTLGLISAVARRREPARLMIVGTYRPGAMLANDHPLRIMKQELELHRYCEELRLKLLSEAEVGDYLAKRFASNGWQQFDGIASAIRERTEGNPLYMVNVVDYLVDTGLVVSSAEVGASGSTEILRVDRIEVPRSIRQMIEHNLERLQPEEQAVLEGASVAGAEFSAAVVAAALERPQDEVEACCMRLSRHEQFVTVQGPVAWPDGTIATRFCFHHALYQEVLYGRLPVGQRLRLHRLVAAREEIGFGERVAEVASELAHHYERAKDRDMAIHYLQQAGERAVARGAMVEAEGHYRRSLNLLDELPHTIERDRHELALQIELGDILWSSRSWSHPEAARTYEHALELAEKLGETTQLVTVAMGLAIFALGRGKFRLAQELAERMLLAAEYSNDRTALSAAHTVVGETLIWRARYAEAREHFDSANSYYDDTVPGLLRRRGFDAPALEAIVVLLLGFSDRARQLMDEATRRGANCVETIRAGIVHLWGGMLCGLLRDAQETLKHAQALRRLAVNQPVWGGLADTYTGKALMFRGKWDEGIDYIHRGTAFHESVGLHSQVMWAKLDEVEFFTHQGQIDEGLTLVADALADSEELAQIKSPALRQRADLLAHSDVPSSEIEEAYRAAIECAHNQGAKYYELETATHFARWLKSQGRFKEARSILAPIYNWFTEGFDTVALEEAKALLDELSNKPSAPRRPSRRRKGR
jgi:DNA-binding winged helix-turn-helix (wHTH) protein/tetratricopeptide (TPR) repeat protein